VTTLPPASDAGLPISFLRSVPVFGGLDDEELALLGRFLRREPLPADVAVVREGELAKEMYVVETGRVAILKAGRAEPVNVLGPGQSFGEMSLIDIQPRSATVLTMEPTTVLALGFDDVVRIYNRNLPMYTLIVLNIAREISRRLRDANRRIAALGHDEIPHP
jgi:CRP-like cAMP-binding protein